MTKAEWKRMVYKAIADELLCGQHIPGNLRLYAADDRRDAERVEEAIHEVARMMHDKSVPPARKARHG